MREITQFLTNVFTFYISSDKISIFFWWIFINLYLEILNKCNIEVDKKVLQLLSGYFSRKLQHIIKECHDQSSWDKPETLQFANGFALRDLQLRNGLPTVVFEFYCLIFNREWKTQVSSIMYITNFKLNEFLNSWILKVQFSFSIHFLKLS